MNRMPIEKYQPFQPIDLPDRQWPTRKITRAPVWCSVDLRDGNQALVDPMDGRRKLHMFETLVEMGFKEIEVGFPSASKTDFDFARKLIDEDRIPEDVTIQVLTQAREPLIRRTFESISGCRRAILHLYNSTSTLQRRVVFGLDRDGITDIAVNSARLVRELAEGMNGSEIVYQYSPESFTGTELDFAVSICEAVCDVWEPTPEKKTIINLPGDGRDGIGQRLRGSDRVVHPQLPVSRELRHQPPSPQRPGDRSGRGGTGGDGRGRPGRGHPVRQRRAHRQRGRRQSRDEPVHPGHRPRTRSLRHRPAQGRRGVLQSTAGPPSAPVAGELVYTAFSGSHQDAIQKGMTALERSNSGLWEVPYLPVDPRDVGRDYEAIIRVNSQSGKGGVSYLLKADHGLDLPRNLQVEFSRVVQDVTDQSGREISSEDIWKLFESQYLSEDGPFEFVEHWSVPDTHASERRKLTAAIRRHGEELTIVGRGNGPIAAFVNALETECSVKISVKDYHEHALGRGADATAMAYVEVASESGDTLFGVGRHPNITNASLRAILCAVNRHLARAG